MKKKERHARWLSLKSLCSNTRKMSHLSTSSSFMNIMPSSQLHVGQILMICNNTNYLLGLENLIYLTILIKKRQKRVRD